MYETYQVSIKETSTLTTRTKIYKNNIFCKKLQLFELQSYKDVTSK